VCDLETSRMGAPYIYDISRLRVKESNDSIGTIHNIKYKFIRHWALKKATIQSVQFAI